MRVPAYIFAALIVAFLASGCSAPVNDLSFTGTWNSVKENGISGQEDQATIAVLVKGNRFKITSRDSETETTDAYDGKMLRHKSTSSQEGTATDKSDIEVEPARFWKRSFSGGGIPGGQIAGRETVLHQVQENRPDGEVTVQAWVDAENRIVLKKVFTLYSSQLEQVVSRDTEECQEIHFGPIDESVFGNL